MMGQYKKRGWNPCVAGFNVSQKDLSPQVGYFQDFGTGETAADEDGRQEQVVLRYYYDIRMLQITYSFSRRKPVHMGVSKNSGTPRSSIFIGFSIINHPFWGTPIFGNTHMYSTYLHLRYDFSFWAARAVYYRIQYLDATSDEWLLCRSGWADTKNIVFLYVYLRII